MTAKTEIGTHAKNKTYSLYKHNYTWFYDKSGKPSFPYDQYRP